MPGKTEALGSKGDVNSDSQLEIVINPRNIAELRKNNTTSVKVVEDSSPNIGIVERSLKDAKLRLGKGVEMVIKNNDIYFRSNLWYFVGIVIVIALSTILIVAYLLQKQETKTVIREKIVKVPAKSKKQELTKDSNKKSDLEDEEEKELKIFKSLKEVIEVIEHDPEASSRIYKEAVKLRKEGNEEEEFDRKESLKLFKQAIMRLRALLQKGEITNYYRLQTAYQLWVIYRCHLTKYKKAEKEMRATVKLYNRGAKRKVKLSCPKL